MAKNECFWDLSKDWAVPESGVLPFENIWLEYLLRILSALNEEYRSGRSTRRPASEVDQSRFLLVFPMPGLNVFVGSSW